MPCYEPPLEHDTRRAEFLAAALCAVIDHAPLSAINGVPGLAEWCSRHRFIDINKGGDAILGAMGAARAYDKKQGRDYYDGPLFMQQWLDANPKR